MLCIYSDKLLHWKTLYTHKGRLFTKGIPIPGKGGLYIETGPWSCAAPIHGRIDAQLTILLMPRVSLFWAVKCYFLALAKSEIKAIINIGNHLLLQQLIITLHRAHFTTVSKFNPRMNK